MTSCGVRGMAERRRAGGVRAAALVAVLAAGAVEAGEASTVRLHEAYLSEPTEWCAADAGVPVVISIDGPDLFVGVPLADQPTSVRVRRGGNDVQRIDVGRKDPTEILTRHGTDRTHSSTATASVSAEPASVTPVGRLKAEITLCQSLWDRAPGTASWRVIGADGTVAADGDEAMLWISETAFFDTFRPYPQALKLGDATFVVMEYPTFEKTTEAFASPAEETRE